MNNTIVLIFNGISIIAIICAIIILLLKHKGRERRNIIIIIFSYLLLILSGATNLLEHLNLSDTVDQYEDYLSILFIPVIIFSINNLIINEELRKRTISENKSKAIINQAFSFVCLLNYQGKIIEANETAFQFLGTEYGILLGYGFSDILWGDKTEPEHRKIEEAIENAKNGQTVRFGTYYFVPSKKMFYIDFSIKPIFDENSQLIYLVVEGRDITEIKEAKKQLEDHKNNLELVVSQRTNALNVSNEELIEKNASLFQKTEELEQTLKQLKIAQEQLFESEKMASLGVLISGIAHEINNPLNYIHLGVNGLKKFIIRTESLISKYHELLHKINDEELLNKLHELNQVHLKNANYQAAMVLIGHVETGVNRTVDVVQSLKYFSSSANNNVLESSIHDILDSVLTILRHEYIDRIQIVKNYHLNKTVFCTPGEINQVIMNLLSNAIHSIEQEGIIEISTAELSSFALISIKDNGVGIPNDIVGKIFDPFFTTKPAGRGKGMGLSIAYGIINKHKGKIFVNSTPGNGSEFIIELPYH